jgi:heme/copper-type cytochrome/quinol oxidase subunit 3
MEIVEHGKGLDISHHAPEHEHHGVNAEEYNYLLKFGWWVYIASEVMLFGSFIAVMALAARLYPEWQDELAVPLTSLGTFLLLTSSWTVVRALNAAQEDDKVNVPRWLFLTLALGVTFTLIQIYEYTHLSHDGFKLGAGMYPDIFYVLTGFHGVHVFIGEIWILRCFIKSLNGDFHANNSMGLEILGLYWHFVDVVWIVLFPLIYLF